MQSVTTTLLQTKLYAPVNQSDFVVRPHLIEKLRSETLGKITLVTAPAGFGKTTLVTQWLSQIDHPFSWLSLDENDNDLTRFLSYFVAAIQQTNPQIGHTLQELIRSPQSTSIETMLTMLINDLAQSAVSLILVLDDYHVIDAKPVHEALTFFLAHMPPTMHLVITSRVDPPLSLPRLRVRHQMNEIREADLRFSTQEALAFLNERMGLTLAMEQVEALLQRTEGWIASLQLAGLAMQTTPSRQNIDQFLDAFTGSHHYIVDYLVDEVLQHCSPEVRSFLLKTAVLDSFSAPLCDAVTGQENSQDTLNFLRRTNLFLIPQDDQQKWYRYHHLFADAMRQQLQQQLGQEAKQSLHAKAAQWYQAQPGMLDSAIYHALQAGDDTQAAKWIAQTAPATLWGRGEATRLCRQIESLPPEKLTQYPRLSALLAWAYFISGNHGKASEKMAQAVTNLSQAGGDYQDELVMGLAAALQAFEARAAGDFDQSIQFSHQALAQLVDQNKMLQAILYLNLGAAYDHIGSLRQASDASQKLLQVVEGTNNSYLRLEAMGGLAYVAHERGQLHRSLEICQEALQMVGERPLPGVAIIKSRLANLFYEWNELEQADKYAQEASKLSEHSGLISELPSTNFRRAVIALHNRDETAVTHYRQQILQVIRKVPTPFLKTVLKALIADLDLRRNHLEKAWRWLQTTDLLIKDLPDRANTSEMYTFIVSIQIAIAHCRVHSDSELLAAIVVRLQQLLHISKNVGHVQFQIRIQLLMALAYDLQNNQAEALATLKETFPLTEPGHYCRVFIDLGEPMAKLLLAIQKEHISSNYIAELLTVFAAENLLPAQTEIPRSIESPQIEPLHKQELAILRLMAAGLSNRQIAEELFLSINTVKWYIKSLYEKLDVSNRVEAVARATELGFINR